MTEKSSIESDKIHVQNLVTSIIFVDVWETIDRVARKSGQENEPNKPAFHHM